MGEVGYVATGFKSVRECRVGDTITLAVNGAAERLPGYKQVKPMVFAGIYPVDNDDYGELRDALEKLQLNDASLVYEPETSQALNFGFRVGFLGLFHMDIVQERLEREYELDILATAPSVEYQIVLRNGEVIEIDSPAAAARSEHDRGNPRTLDENPDFHAGRVHRRADGSGDEEARRIRHDGVPRQDARRRSSIACRSAN